MSLNCSNCGKELTQQELDNNPKNYVNKKANGTTSSTVWLCSKCHQDQIEHKGAVEK
jgi:hypothetical protein